jgi:hypothetical protein
MVKLVIPQHVVTHVLTWKAGGRARRRWRQNGHPAAKKGSGDAGNADRRNSQQPGTVA